MFRENVLIALTLLITILALSFIILMTVFMQLHEFDRRVKLLDKMLEKEKQERNQVSVEDWQSKFVTTSKPFPMVNFDIPATENIVYPAFGFHDEKSPSNAIIFPFHFYRTNGHLSVGTPRKDENANANLSSVDVTQELVLLEVVKRINDYVHMRNLEKDQEQQQRHASAILQQGHKNRRKTIRPPEQGHVWFQQETLENLISAHQQNQNQSRSSMSNHDDALTKNSAVQQDEALADNNNNMFFYTNK